MMCAECGEFQASADSADGGIEEIMDTLDTEYL